MDETCLGPCPINGFVIKDVQPSGEFFIQRTGVRALHFLDKGVVLCSNPGRNTIYFDWRFVVFLSFYSVNTAIRP
jgi:hypothetical protein